MARAVAITGMALTCGLGDAPASVARALLAGTSAVGPVRAFDARPLPTGLAVEVDGPVPLPDGFEDDRKVGLLARAVRAFGPLPDAIPAERRGLFLGTGLSSLTPRELAEDVYPFLHGGRIDREAATRHRAVGVAPGRHLPARATGWLAHRLGIAGPGGTSFSACAAAAEAIAAGARAVARGEADLVLAGGHDSMIHPLGLLSFQALGALSPGGARPFDRDRDGFVPAEGAALVRLEPARGDGRALAFVRGAGSSLDAHGVTAPHPDGIGAEAAMRRALDDAGCPPEGVAFVKAHATGTPVGDRAEARAVARLLGPGVPVVGLKGGLGHALAASGAVELVALLACLVEGALPPTVGCRHPEAGLGIDVVCAPRPLPGRLGLLNSFGFGGQNTSLLVEAA